MTARSALWAVAFCLPVAVAVGFSISLHRKRAELLATIDQLNASLGRHRDTLKAASAENKDRLDRMAAFREQVKRIDDSLPPWQRRLQAVRLAWADLIRQGRAGAVTTAPVVQFSAKQPYFLQLMGDPAYAKAVEALMRQQVEGDYGRFLASDNLSPQAQDQLPRPPDAALHGPVGFGQPHGDRLGSDRKDRRQGPSGCGGPERDSERFWDPVRERPARLQPEHGLLRNDRPDGRPAGRNFDPARTRAGGSTRRSAGPDARARGAEPVGWCPAPWSTNPRRSCRLPRRRSC